MASVSGAEVRQADHARREPRAKLFKLARLRTATSGFRAHILDISTMGARLHCAAPLDPGQRVTLDISGHSLPATVLRISDGRAGVRFHLRLDDAAVREIAR